MSRKDRKLRNLLLEPMLQVKIGIYCVILSLLFAIAVVSVLYLNFQPLVANILELTDVPDELNEILSNYWSSSQLWVYGIVVVYMAVVISMSIWYTHRLVGPIVAFARHIDKLKEGDYSARTFIRKNDAFTNVAIKLNELSDVLKAK